VRGWRSEPLFWKRIVLAPTIEDEFADPQHNP
jgi:hypothetical protein